MIYAFLITTNYKYKYCFLSLYGVWIYLPSKKSHLDLVNGHFSTFLNTVCSDIDDDNIFREFLIRQTF